jgi:hypothetical protein
MNKKITMLIGCLTLFANFSYSKQIREKSQLNIRDTIKNKEYSFIIQDTPSAIFTMRQSNEDC